MMGLLLRGWIIILEQLHESFTTEYLKDEESLSSLQNLLLKQQEKIQRLEKLYNKLNNDTAKSLAKNRLVLQQEELASLEAQIELLKNKRDRNQELSIYYGDLNK